MIYTLEAPYNQGLYVQWFDALKRTGLKYESLIWNLSNDSTFFPFETFLNNDSIIGLINSKITEDDYLLIDSAFTQPRSELEFYHRDSYVFDKLLELKAKKIYIFHPDTGWNYGFEHDKIKIISPMYNILKNDDIRGDYNFYLFNSGYSNHRWLSQAVFDRYLEMRRYKKFLSHNGYLKPHRTLLYHLLKRDDILKEFFYSNIAYNVYDRDSRYIGDEDEISYNAQMVVPFGNDIESIISKEEYDTIIMKDFPIFMDYSPLMSNVDQYAFTLPYTSNSYFEVICGTNYSSTMGEWGEVYTSEKIFKCFISFQIPLFLCQPFLCETLKKLGFDLFEDLIDLSYDTERNDLTKILMFYENIKKINSMSLKEIHKYYLDNRSRLINNFNLTKELSDIQIESLKNMLQ